MSRLEDIDIGNLVSRDVNYFGHAGADVDADCRFYGFVHESASHTFKERLDARSELSLILLAVVGFDRDGWDARLFESAAHTDRLDVVRVAVLENVLNDSVDLVFLGEPNHVIDALCVQYESSFDKEERSKILHDIDRRIFAAHPCILGWASPDIRLVYWNRFGHPEWTIGRTSGPESVLTTWWVDPQKEKELKHAKRDPEVRLDSSPRMLHYWRRESLGDFRSENSEFRQVSHLPH